MVSKVLPEVHPPKHDQVFLGRDFSSQPDYSPEIAYKIDQEIRRIVDEASDKARSLLTKSRKKLDQIAKTLVEKETLEKEELIELLAGKKISSKKTTPSKKVQEKVTARESKKKKVGDIPGKLRPAEG